MAVRKYYSFCLFIFTLHHFSSSTSTSILHIPATGANAGRKMKNLPSNFSAGIEVLLKIAMSWTHKFPTAYLTPEPNHDTLQKNIPANRLIYSQSALIVMQLSVICLSAKAQLSRWTPSAALFGTRCTCHAARGAEWNSTFRAIRSFWAVKKPHLPPDFVVLLV